MKNKMKNPMEKNMETHMQKTKLWPSQLWAPVLGSLMMILCSVMITSHANAAAGDYVPEQIRVNNYYRELVKSQLETMVPKGSYTVDVNVQIDPAKIHNYFSKREINVSLPLGGALSESGGSSIHQEAPNSILLEDLLKLVNKKTIRVGVSESVPPVIRNLIKDSIQSQLNFSPNKGETVETYDLPKEFLDSWSQQPQAANGAAHDNKGLWLLLVGIVTFCGIIGIFFYFGMSSLSKKVLSQLEATSKLWTENQAPSMDMDFKMDSPQAKAGGAAFAEGVSESRIFEKLDLTTLKLICADCVSQPQTKYIPYSLIYHWLDAGLSESLDQALPEAHKPVPGTADSVPGKTEVTQFLTEYFPQFRTLGRSEFAQKMAKYTLEQVSHFIGTLDTEDSVVVLDKLTPLKKRACIATLPIEKRMECSKLSIKKWSADKLSSKEAKLSKAFEQFASSFVSLHDNMDEVEGSVLEPQYLTVNTFADDEHLYEMSQNEPELYTGMIRVIQDSPAEFWLRTDVKEMAMVTYGYSQGILDQVQNQFTGKRREWYKSFIDKFAQAGLAYDHPMVVEIRKKILSRHVPLAKTESETIQHDDSQKAA